MGVEEFMRYDDVALKTTQCGDAEQALDQGRGFHQHVVRTDEGNVCESNCLHKAAAVSWCSSSASITA